MTDAKRRADDPGEPATPEAIRAGDPAALEAVVDAYLPQVLRAARGAGLKPDEAEEITQETFKTFLEAAPRFEGRSRVRTFLFGILYRKIAEARRGMARDRTHDPIDEVMEARFAEDGSWVRPPRPADHVLRTRETRRALADCLDASPPSSGATDPTNRTPDPPGRRHSSPRPRPPASPSAGAERLLIQLAEHPV